MVEPEQKERDGTDAFPWKMVGDPPDPPRPRSERYGAGICATGRCIEPCGSNGGCAR